jgi:hypothetical protein
LQVFGRASGCPSLLLVDEGFAALDPRAKALVRSKLKAFCKRSLVLVIYHTDASAHSNDSNLTSAAAGEGAMASTDEGGSRCLPAGGFFDANLHFDGGVAALRPLCPGPAIRG